MQAAIDPVHAGHKQEVWSLLAVSHGIKTRTLSPTTFATTCRLLYSTALLRYAAEPAQSQDSFGEVAEWSMAHAWKVCIRQRIEGSNPSFSAKQIRVPMGPFFVWR